jgi:hypothetical protein
MNDEPGIFAPNFFRLVGDSRAQVFGSARVYTGRARSIRGRVEKKPGGGRGKTAKPQTRPRVSLWRILAALQPGELRGLPLVGGGPGTTPGWNPGLGLAREGTPAAVSSRLVRSAGPCRALTRTRIKKRQPTLDVVEDRGRKSA